jgi:hypothetical protein
MVFGSRAPVERDEQAFRVKAVAAVDGRLAVHQAEAEDVADAVVAVEEAEAEAARASRSSCSTPPSHSPRLSSEQRTEAMAAVVDQGDPALPEALAALEARQESADARAVPVVAAQTELRAVAVRAEFPSASFTAEARQR